MKQTIKLRESELKKMISESVKRVMNESQYQDSYDWAMHTLNRRLKKHSIEDVVSFAEQELQFMDNMTPNNQLYVIGTLF